MKVYTVKNLDTGVIKKIATVDVLGLRMRIEVDNQSAGQSQYERVDDENMFIHIPNKIYELKKTFQILSCEPYNELTNPVGAPLGSHNARQGAENKVKSLFGLRLPKDKDIELRKRVKDSGLSNNDYFIKHMRL